MEVESVESYKERLLKNPYCEMEARSLAEFLYAVIAISGTRRRAIYRGMADESWKIESSAYIKLKKKDKKPTLNELRKYHSDLMDEVKNLHDDEVKYKGVTLLAHLQHNYVKTGLIDYTFNPLTALWFACSARNEDEKSAKGVVYCTKTNDFNFIDGETEVEKLFNEMNKKVEKSYSETNTVYLFNPPKINRRIISQQSVFLFSANGFVDKEQHTKIFIPSDCKEEISKQLSLVGVSRKVLFHDFHGLYEWFDSDDDAEKEKYDEIIGKANTFRGNFEFNKAIGLYKEAVVLGAELFGEESEEIADVYSGTASVYYDKGDYDLALDSYNKAMEIRENVFGKEHPETADAYNSIGNVCADKGDYIEAEKYYEKALKIRKNIFKENSPYVANTYNNIGNVYYNNKKYDKALKYYEKALNFRKKDLEDPKTSNSYHNIANVYRRMGENDKKYYENAKKYYDIALDIRERVLGKEHPKTSSTYNKIGELYCAQKEYDKALKFYYTALEIREKVLGTEHPKTADTYENIGLVHDNKGEYDKALEYYNKALAIRARVFGTDHPRTNETRKNIENIQEKLREKDEGSPTSAP